MAAIMITRLDRYLLVAILRGVGLVAAVLLTLGGSFLFMEQQDDIGVGQYTTGDALLFVLLNLPQQVLLHLATHMNSALISVASCSTVQSAQ